MLIVTSIVAYRHGYYEYYRFERNNIPGCLACWIAMCVLPPFLEPPQFSLTKRLLTVALPTSPLYALSAFDMGKPSRITITGGFAFDMGEKDGDEVVLPQTYRDVEVGAEGTAGGKTGVESPPNIYAE